MRLVKYEHAYMFHYSMRDKTAAARHLVDDVPEVGGGATEVLQSIG